MGHYAGLHWRSSMVLALGADRGRVAAAPVDHGRALLPGERYQRRARGRSAQVPGSTPPALACARTGVRVLPRLQLSQRYDIVGFSPPGTALLLCLARTAGRSSTADEPA